MNRKMRIEHILHRQMVQEHVAIRRKKKTKGSSFGFTAMKRIKDLPDGYDTENESSWGPGGLVTNHDEPRDFGEEALRHKKVIDRAIRRLLREEAGGALDGLVAGYRKRKRKVEMERYGNQGGDSNRDNNNRASQSHQGRERDRELRSGHKRGIKNQQQQNHSQHRNQHSYNHRNHSHNSSNAPGSGRGLRDRSEGEARREEGLDDLDLDLLGESRASDHTENDYSGMDNDSEADDVTDEEP